MRVMEAEEAAAVHKRVAAFVTIPIGGYGYNFGRMFIAKFTTNRLAQVGGGALVAGPLCSVSTDVLSSDVEYYIYEPKRAAAQAAIGSVCWFAGGAMFSPAATVTEDLLGARPWLRRADPVTKRLMEIEVRDRLAQAGGPKTGAPESIGVRPASVRVGRINPNEVRFSQSGVRETFQEGGTVEELADGLRTGRIEPDGVPPIRLVEREGMLFTLDNRPLEAFRRAGVEVPYRMATSEEAAREAWKFTTPNQGLSVRIRGQNP